MLASVKSHISDDSFRMLLKGSLTDRLILLASVAGIIAAWLLVQSLVASGPAIAEIYHGKTLLASYPLPLAGEKPIYFDVDGELGTSSIRLDEDGARMVSSPCAAQRCVYSGVHRHAGDMVACIPNRVLITIRGQAELATRYDAIVE